MRYRIALSSKELSFVLTALSAHRLEQERADDPSDAVDFGDLLEAIGSQADDQDLKTFGCHVTREWAMPDKYTFRIKPVQRLLKKYVESRHGVWIDPFAGFHSPVKETNDLNPHSPAKHHMQAADFVKRYARIDGVLFDPPYSPRQIKECYQSAGLDVTQEATQNARLYKEVRDAIADRMKTGGLALSFGWNSTGFGKARGFAPVEALIISHGGAHNDTICLVERKHA